MDYSGRARWLKTREKGYLKFVLINGLGYWGITMFLIMTFVVFRPFQDGFSLGMLIIHVLIWATAGIAFGIGTWTLSERKLRSSGYREGET